MIQKADLRAYATPDDLYSQLLIYRAVDDGAILLLEGDSDYGALEQHIDAESCIALPGHGKSVVMGAMELVDANGMQGIAVLIDKDFAGVLYPFSDSPNIFYTDCSDIDSTIFSMSGPRERVVSNFCDPVEKRQHLSLCGMASSLELAIELAFPVGVLRWISERDGHGLNLDRFPIEAVLVRDCNCIDLQKACAIAVKRTKIEDENLAVEIFEALQAGVAEIEDRYSYCSGHDLVKALAAVMRKKWRGKFSFEVIEGALRSALSYEDLRSTKFFAALKQWAERSNLVIWARSM